MELLLREADMSLQASKRAGGGRTQLYSPALGRQSQRAAEMAGALVDALASSQFHMVYQPVFSMDGDIVAFEALLRWQHPVWGHRQPFRIYSNCRKERGHCCDWGLGH